MCERQSVCFIVSLCVCSRTWVGDDHEGAVGAVFDDLRDDGSENVNVPLDQVEPALSFLLAHASRHHHNTGVGGHCIICDTHVINSQ